LVTVTAMGDIGDIGLDIGGPIAKDKLWFYAGVDVARTRFNLRRTLNATRLNADGTVDRNAASQGIQDYIPGTESNWVAESTQIQAMGKLTYAVNQDNQLALAVYATPTSSGGNGKYAISPLTGQPETDPRTTAGLNGPYNALAHKVLGSSFDTSLKWTSAFLNKRLLIDTTVGWHHETGGILPSDGSAVGTSNGLAGLPRVVWRRNNPGVHNITDFESVPSGYCQTAAACPATTYNTGGPDFLREQALDRYQGRSILTYLLQAAGHHVIKAGIDIEMMSYRNVKAYSGTVRYRESTSGSSFAWNRGYGFLSGPDQHVTLSKLDNTTRSLTAGGFVQDSWSVLDKVTLNLGVRYDAQFLYDGLGNRGLNLPNQWSPRAGVIYDPTQAGRAKLFANFARFYESVPLDMADRALSGESGLTAVHTAGCNDISPNGPCTGAANRLPGTGTPPNSVFAAAGGAGSIAIDPNIRPQSSDEIVGGGEYELMRDARLGLSYTKRWMNYVIEDMSRDEAQTYFLGNPGYGTASDFPKPKRDYDAVTVYLTKVFSDDWLAQASYTISYLRGNYAGLFRPETQQLDPNINSDFDLRSLLANRDGPLPGDRTHQIKLYGAKDWVVTPEHHITSGVSLRARSGNPTGFLGSHPIYTLDETFILPRGSGIRTPWEFGADLQLGYRFNIDKDKTVQATVDVFNIFNLQAVTQKDQRYTASDVLPVPGGTPNADGTIPGITRSDGSEFLASEINANFGRPTAYQAPRVFRFGLRTTF